MKILISNKFFYPRGGDCIHTIGLKQLLEENGHVVAVFSMQYPENLPHGYSVFWPSMLNFSTEKPGRLKEALLRPLYSSEVKRKWNALLDDFQPDIVHLHNIHTQLSPVIAKEAYKRQIPVFWTLHDYKLICPSYSFLQGRKVCEACLKDSKSVIRNRCIKGSLVGSLIGYWEARQWNRQKLQRYTIRFIAPSRFMQNKMLQAGYSHLKFSQLYNFADADKFNAIKQKQDYYMFLGRFSEEKGIETLLKAAEHRSYKLKLVGDGPLRKKLEEKYRSAHIEFLGYQRWDMVKVLLGQARFMVIPSEWYENNPLSVIEAFALGTPVLGTRIGGIPELIDETNGMLFEPGKVEDLSFRIDEMMHKTDWDYARISSNAAQKFSAHHYYEQLMKIYSNGGYKVTAMS
jgi:glycosyltransferase involved in cell wall biosynthesis